MLEAMLHASECALLMHDSWLPADDEDEDEDMSAVVAAIGGGSSPSWGVSPGGRRGRKGGYTDEDVQVCV